MDRLELHAVPVALQAVDELFEFACPEALRAVCDCIQSGDVTEARRNFEDPAAQGRRRFAPLDWSGVQRHLDAITGPPANRPAGKIPKAMTSRLILTLAQMTWRLSSDTQVHDLLASTSRGSQSTDVGETSLLPNAAQRAELADLALAFVACALVSDAVRDSRVTLKQETRRHWSKSSNSRILWSVYTSDAGANVLSLPLKESAKLAGGSLPRIAAQGSPGNLHVRQYDEAARSALANEVARVALFWCPSDPSLIDVGTRAQHWSGAVLAQVHIWLGDTDRGVHGQDDTPW